MDDFESKKILVTGGLGFVGSNLSLRLKDLNCKVTIADKELKNSFRLAPYEKHFTIKRCDLTDYDQIHKIVGGYDIVFHLAAQTSHAFSMKNPQLDADINVRGTLNLLEALRNNNENAKFVFSSTKGVSGTPSSLPVNEETPTNPLDVYSANKLLAEEYCKIYNNHFDIDFSILRLTNIFGPRQQITSPSLGILNFFIGRAMKDEIITTTKRLQLYRKCNRCFTSMCN